MHCLCERNSGLELRVAGLVGLVSTFRVSDRVRGFGLVLRVSCSSDVTDTVYKDVIDFLCFERK